MAWCENEMKKASRELGYGDDWHKALEHVKNLYVEPGKQPQMIRDLALEAIKFVEDNNLVTVPELAKESWRMEMMTPERQLVSPFFLGGETIRFIPHQHHGPRAKMMSMRGNNIHFARATVHHEAIPGHHLQGFHVSAQQTIPRHFRYAVLDRRKCALLGAVVGLELREDAREPHRNALLAHAPLCAHHLLAQFSSEKMTPQECTSNYSSTKSGNSDNAISGSETFVRYAVLVRQIAVFDRRTPVCNAQRAGGLRKDDERAFNDALLKENRIPIEMLRAAITNQKLTRDFVTNWKFYTQINTDKNTDYRRYWSFSFTNIGSVGFMLGR